ncbi:MAG: hypothetical protein Q7U98_17210 [Methylicorpusculum sp.]|uniref:hypothetical protein n=1 Tax=Methylicorpusculum sp. TaxID=2713644 RepID=UPI00272929E8|nr:hypothetical protein [Methylicorpusculum sp.]MDO8940896.1 hypothetical protein [Methylicorpusculum sp.]MDP2202413.1 hypothetical protein [Methylicorpusculum sp.]
MTDYPELYRRLAQEILKHEGKIGRDTQAFVEQLLIKLRTEGWRIGPETDAVLTEHLQQMQTALQTGIAVSAQVATGLPLASEVVRKLTEQAFVERWPDGLTLSSRVWKWQNETRNGVQKVLQDGIRQGAATNRLVMAMQREIERTTGGQRFKVVEAHVDDWVTELYQSAEALIHDPTAKQQWQQTAGQVREYIESLKTTGSRNAADRVFDQISKAVANGNEVLLEKAAKWWLYDRQQYALKRIARTEMATALHRGVIASTLNDETVIGYQWRLSASHPVTDICDYYADIDMGLGKGVWTKEAVPKHKAHPHCVLGDTVIHVPGAVVAATQSFYQGVVIEIVTRNSRRLSCTRNHSILTTDGWLDAQFIQKGQQIITAAEAQSGAFYPNDCDMPATIEEIFNSFLKSSGVSAVAVPVASEHFHGDGRFMKGNINIVNVDGLLLGEVNAAASKHVSQHDFITGHAAQNAFLGNGVANFLRDAFRLSPDGCLSVGGDSAPSFPGGSAHVERLAFLDRPDGDIVFFEDSIDDNPRDIVQFSQSFNGFAGFIESDNFSFGKSDIATHVDASISEYLINGFPIDTFISRNGIDANACSIALDEVVEVIERDFSGFVYDLQVDPHHWYFANGIVTHNCMCLIIPRVTPIQQKGASNYAKFLQRLPEEKRKELLPDWLRNFNELGMAMDKMVRPDGLGPVTREMMKARMGVDKFKAASALSKSLVEKQWPSLKLKLKMPQTRDTLATLHNQSSIPEVAAFLSKLDNNGYQVNSDVWHYFRYKYHFGDSALKPKTLDARFDAVLKDPDAEVHRPDKRLVVVSKKNGRMSYVHEDGKRISVYAYTDVDLAALGAPLWLMKDLIT